MSIISGPNLVAVQAYARQPAPARDGAAPQTAGVVDRVEISEAAKVKAVRAIASKPAFSDFLGEDKPAPQSSGGEPPRREAPTAGLQRITPLGASVDILV